MSIVSGEGPREELLRPLQKLTNSSKRGDHQIEHDRDAANASGSGAAGKLPRGSPSFGSCRWARAAWYLQRQNRKVILIVKTSNVMQMLLTRPKSGATLKLFTNQDIP